MCATVNAYVHQFLILNANTVTCKHVFSVEFHSGLLFSWWRACIRLHKSTSGLHCVSGACQSESRIVRCSWRSKLKVFRRKQLTIKHTTPVAEQAETFVRPRPWMCVCLSWCLRKPQLIALWHEWTKGQITIQRIHMNAVFKETSQIEAAQILSISKL